MDARLAEAGVIFRATDPDLRRPGIGTVGFGRAPGSPHGLTMATSHVVRKMQAIGLRRIVGDGTEAL